MNKVAKKMSVLDFVMTLPLASVPAILTITVSERLAAWWEWGQFTMPATATYEELIRVAMWQLPFFVILLFIPRYFLYRKAERGGKLWVYFIYVALPIMVHLVMPPFSKFTTAAWWIIATIAWAEVLTPLFQPLYDAMAGRGGGNKKG